MAKSHKSKNKKAASHNKSSVNPTSTPPKNEEFSQEFSGKLNNNSSSKNKNNGKKSANQNGGNGRHEFSQELTDIIQKSINNAGNALKKFGKNK